MYNFLSGYGVYLTAVVAAIGAGLQSLGLITPEKWATLMGILIPFFAVFFRRAIATSKAAVVAEVDDVKAQVAVVDRKVATVAPTVAHAVAAEVKAVVADKAPSVSYPIEAPHIHRP